MTEAAKNDSAPATDEQLLADATARQKGDEKGDEKETKEEAVEPEKVEAEESEDEESETKDTEAKKRPRRSSRRDRIIAQQGQQLRELTRALQEMTAKNPTETKEPREQDYAKYEDYQKDRDDYSREMGKREASEEARRRQDEQTERQKAEDSTRRKTEFGKKGSAKYDDFAEYALNPANFDPSPEVAEIILESDMSHDVAYWLGKNPDEADRLEDMTMTQAARFIGQIENRLSSKPKPKTTKTPEPIKPIGGGREMPKKDLADIAKNGSFNEYKKARGF